MQAIRTLTRAMLCKQTGSPASTPVSAHTSAGPSEAGLVTLQCPAEAILHQPLTETLA